jgi:hypothetical protein
MRPWLCIALLLCSLAVTAAEDGVVRYYGYAYHLDGGRYAYTELMEQRMTGGKWTGGRTLFYLPDGTEFGRKTLDFAQDPFVPAYRFELGGGYVEGLALAGSTITMTRTQRGKTEEARAEKAGTVTADAGMPRLLRAHLDALLRGEALQFRVFAPVRLATYKFRAKRVEDTTFEQRPAVRVQVDMDSMLKLFAGPLSFTFDAQSHRLLEFRGVTNVLDPATGEPFRVRVSYFTAPPGDVPTLPPMPK